jgi:hypothetical protein
MILGPGSFTDSSWITLYKIKLYKHELRYISASMYIFSFFTSSKDIANQPHNEMLT